MRALVVCWLVTSSGLIAYAQVPLDLEIVSKQPREVVLAEPKFRVVLTPKGR